MCNNASATEEHPDIDWNYYHFDGRGFITGPSIDGKCFLAVSEYMTPVIVEAQNQQITSLPLPTGKGALAGICYAQNSGGKMGAVEGYAPSPGVSVIITSARGFSTIVQTDEAGFFVAMLDVGGYTVSHGLFSSRIALEHGATVLVPLRTGKRMVD